MPMRKLLFPAQRAHIRDLGLDPEVLSRIHHNCLQQLRREGERMTAQTSISLTPHAMMRPGSHSC